MEYLALILFSFGMVVIVCIGVFNWFLHREVYRLFFRLNIRPPHPLKMLVLANVYIPLITGTMLLLIVAIYR